MYATIPRSRWYLKKSARKGLAFGAWLSGALHVRKAVSPAPRVRVLTYHRVGEIPYDPFCIRPEAFEAQMRWLAERQLALSLDEVERFVRGDFRFPGDRVLVTIDDGFLSTHAVMMPILRKYAVPAVAFVTASAIDQEAGPHPERYMTWRELRDLPAANVAVGSHAFTHRSLGRMSAAEAQQEGARSRALLQERLEAPVTSFAYPFGTRRDYSPETDRLLAACGYTLVFNSQHGAVRGGRRSGSLPRIKVEGGEDLRMFQLLCRGAMDGWRVVDHLLHRLQGAMPTAVMR